VAVLKVEEAVLAVSKGADNDLSGFIMADRIKIFG
jgi:hypothetical protein